MLGDGQAMLPLTAHNTGRKIIHVDMDMFFAAIEIRDAPSLAAKPVAVGGAASQRGVVATANYVARSFGVRSAMPTARALRLCPGLIVLPPRFDAYRRVSQQIRAILEVYARAVEPLSLDEAYLDVSGSEHYQGSGTLIAEAIRRDIQRATGLTASAGVAPNKFLAKVASDWRKPDGLTVIRPAEIDAFVAALPVARIPGVGPRTRAKLAALGVETCLDLQTRDRSELVDRFGKWGPRLYELCRGRDNRAVVTNRPRKRISVERTFPNDLPDLRACHVKLVELVNELARRIERAAVKGEVRGWSVKLRFDDYDTTTIDRVARPAPVGAWDGGALDALKPMLDEAWSRGRRPVRLLGVGARLASPATVSSDASQLLLWPDLP